MFESINPLIETKHKELRVASSAEQASITPSSGKKIRVYGFQISQTVTVNLTATLRASLSFGTGGVSASSKLIASFRQNRAEDTMSIEMAVNIVGSVDEVVALTNITFSNGGVITRAVVYYNEE